MLQSRVFSLTERVAADEDRVSAAMDGFQGMMTDIMQRLEQLTMSLDDFGAVDSLLTVSMPVNYISNGMVFWTEQYYMYCDYIWVQQEGFGSSFRRAGVFQGSGPYSGVHGAGVPPELLEFEKVLAQIQPNVPALIDSFLTIGKRRMRVRDWFSEFGFSPYYMDMGGVKSATYVEVSQMWPTSFLSAGKVLTTADAAAPTQAELDGSGVDASFRVSVNQQHVPVLENVEWSMDSLTEGLGQDDYIKGAVVSVVKALSAAGVVATAGALGVSSAITTAAGIGVGALIDYAASLTKFGEVSYADPEFMNIGGRSVEDGPLNSFVPNKSFSGDTLYGGYTRRVAYPDIDPRRMNVGNAEWFTPNNYKVTQAGLRSVASSSRKQAIRDDIAYRRIYNFSVCRSGKVADADITNAPIVLGTNVSGSASVLATNTNSVLYVRNGADSFPLLGRTPTAIVSYTVNGSNNGWDAL